MDLEITEYHFGARPGVTMPHKGILAFLGEIGIRQLVSDHYDLLAQSDIKELFPKNSVALEAAKERSADFFVQVMGGHPYYNENRGNPMMVKRHLPFKITADARKTWLNCYKELLPKLNLPDNLLKSYWDYLNVFSAWMVNTKG